MAANAIFSLPPDPHPVESEILALFSGRNFERSRRFAPGSYDPVHLRKFLAALDNPQYSYKTIHIAGTVGKGSVATGLARSLSALGLKTGCYLSPHFVSLTERIVIDSAPISGEELSALWRTVSRENGFAELSFFDALTAMAFLHFRRQNCAWAVVEAGLGGRFDSTNNLASVSAVITRIGFDHEGVLGNTLGKIAWEKAGIIQANQKVFSLPQHDEAMAVLEKEARDKNAQLHIVQAEGATFMERNQNAVLQITGNLLPLSAEEKNAVRAAARMPVFGRWTLLSENPRVIFDGGHNLEAMAAVAEIVNRQGESKCNIFLNTMRERSLEAFCALLREKIRKELSIFLFPLAEPGYYSEPPPGSSAADDDTIRGLLAEKGTLHVFTGTMALYRGLRARFSL